MFLPLPRAWLNAGSYRVLTGLALVWLLAATLMPVVQDEAYYYAWSAEPALGYFDHPPLVALIGWPATFAHGVPVVARLGTLLNAVVTAAAFLRLLRIVGLDSDKAKATALVLAFGNLVGLVFGVLTGPDTGLMLAWVLALSEAALAVQGRPKRWLMAGLATALGFWSKYTMLLIGPVFLWALVAETLAGRRTPTNGRGLLTPWPYLGGCVFVLACLPHLFWNADHDWISLRFQMRHGFASDYMNLPRSEVLPWPDRAAPGSREWQLAQVFKGPPEVAKNKREPHAYDPYVDAASRLFGFVGGELALWGATALLLAHLAWRRWRQRGLAATAAAGTPLASNLPGSFAQGINQAARPLLIAATVVPVAVFALFSLGAKVEANWAAMYLFGAAVLLTPQLLAYRHALHWAFAINCALLAVVLAHVHYGFLPLKPSKDRLLTETHGYPDLGRFLARLGGPLFADSYQITAMTRFYGEGRQTSQWPRMTRDSEFVRHPVPAFTASELAKLKRFWLVTSVDPPHLAGFRAVDMAQLRDCKDTELQVISWAPAQQGAPACPSPIHEWYLVRYETEQRE